MWLETECRALDYAGTLTTELYTPTPGSNVLLVSQAFALEIGSHYVA